MSNKGNNPYGTAAGAYSATAAATDQRVLEGQILLKAALKLEDLSARLAVGGKIPLEEIGDILDYNRKLWLVFVNDTMNPDHPLPQEIKNNIATLGVFVFKRSLDALIDTTPAKIKPLIDINRNIASGLMKQVKNAQSQAPASAPPQKSTDSVI